MFSLFAKLRLFAGMDREVLILTNEEDEVYDYVLDNEYAEKEYEDVRWVKNDRYFWSQVLSCHRCLAPYVTVLVTILYLIFPPLVIIVLSVPGAVIYLKEK